MYSSYIKERWEKAQKSELMYHKKHFVKNKDKKKRRAEINFYLKERFQIDLKFFEGKNVLEVGCGTDGIIYYLDEAKYRIGIEPMNMVSMVEDWKKQFVKKGIGEQIPFKNNSFDIVLAINVLDHVIDPEKVIKECYRVLKRGGKLIIFITDLSPKAVIFRSLLERFDKSHPHHFTEKEFLNLSSIFNLTYHKVRGKRKKMVADILLNFRIKAIVRILLFNELYLIMNK